MLTDITKFFCCTASNNGGGPLSERCPSTTGRRTSGRPTPRTPARMAKRDIVKVYFMREKKASLISTTVTIGTKYYGSKSYNDQIIELRKAVRMHISSNPCHKYCYVFEMNASGVAHAHGIEQGTYQANFINSFQKFGKHNKHFKSYQPVHDTEKYLDYMFKENGETVTNISVNDLREP